MAKPYTKYKDARKRHQCESDNNQKPTSICQNVCELSRDSVRNILHFDLKFHPYKMQVA